MSRGARGTLSRDARPCLGRAACGKSWRRVLAARRAQVAGDTMVPIHGAPDSPPPPPPRGRRLQPDAALAGCCLSAGLARSRLTFEGWLGGGGPNGTRARRGRPGRQPGTSRPGEGAGTWQVGGPHPSRGWPRKRATSGRTEERCCERGALS